MNMRKLNLNRMIDSGTIVAKPVDTQESPPVLISCSPSHTGDNFTYSDQDFVEYNHQVVLSASTIRGTTNEV